MSCGSTSTAILLAELGLKSLHHVWLLRAAKFWNNQLASLQVICTGACAGLL